MPALGKLLESILETRLSYKNEVCIDDDLCQAGFKEIAGPSIIFSYYNPL